MAAKTYALVRNDKGAPLANLTNIVRVLQKDPLWGADRLYYDEFLDTIFIANSPTRAWTDEDDYKTAVYMQEVAGIANVSDIVVGKAVRLVAKQRTRHVVRDWLLTLSWDRVDRVAGAFGRYWGAISQPELYLQAASANFFIGMVARVMSPGCKLDTMPVFEGRQGINKTRALEALGGRHYAVVNDVVSSKDFLQCLRGKWLLEISELQSFSRSDVSHVKSIMSTRSDHYRPSYGRYPIDLPRQCVFGGTTNADDWGTDDTGLRRFWPIICGSIDIDLLHTDRDQIFAEALHLYQSGQSWWVMPASAQDEQAQRQRSDEWAAIILPWCDLQVLQGEAHLSIKDIMLGALKFTPDRLTKADQMRVASILRLAGWRKWLRAKVWEPPLHGATTTDNGSTQKNDVFAV